MLSDKQKTKPVSLNENLNAFQRLLNLVKNSGEIHEKDNSRIISFPSIEISCEDGEDWGVPTDWQEECVALFSTDLVSLEQNGKLYAICDVYDVTGRDLNEGYLYYRELGEDYLQDCEDIYNAIINSK